MYLYVLYIYGILCVLHMNESFLNEHTTNVHDLHISNKRLVSILSSGQISITNI